jgi:hypothetical protein
MPARTRDPALLSKRRGAGLEEKGAFGLILRERQSLVVFLQSLLDTTQPAQKVRSDGVEEVVPLERA